MRDETNFLGVVLFSFLLIHAGVAVAAAPLDLTVLRAKAGLSGLTNFGDQWIQVAQANPKKVKDSSIADKEAQLAGDKKEAAEKEANAAKDDATKENAAKDAEAHARIARKEANAAKKAAKEARTAANDA